MVRGGRTHIYLSLGTSLLSSEIHLHQDDHNCELLLYTKDPGIQAEHSTVQLQIKPKILSDTCLKELTGQLDVA